MTGCKILEIQDTVRHILNRATKVTFSVLKIVSEAHARARAMAL